MIKSSTNKDKKKALITGSAGFIGYHLCLRLLTEGWNVLGLDGMTDYYDISLKKNRNSILEKNENFTFFKERLERKLKAIDSIKKESDARKPTTKQLKDLIFAFNVCRYVKSNAIVLASNKTTVGIGSGQPSRLDSCQIAINKIGSTTALNTKQFEQYTEQIRVWALTDLGIRLMLPNEYE